jgi:L-iditol 2-dehydrogenase
MPTATHTMLAAVLYGKEDLRLEAAPVPVPVPGEIVIRVRAALTCGTDLKVYRRGYHAKMLKPPIPFGHELAGEVASVGAGVQSFRVGDRVVALNSAPCGACDFCRWGQENLCDDLLFNNGAYAEYIRVPARIVEKNTLRVPDALALEHAAMTEPLACVLHGIDETAIQPGQQVVVIGAGPIGLMFIHLMHKMGAEVIAVVRRAAQAETAKRFGATSAVLAEPQANAADVIASVRACTRNQRGADAVIEAVATPQTWKWAVEMVRKGGAVNFFGGCAAGTTVELDTNQLHYNNLTLHASFHHRPGVCRRALDWIASGKLDCAGFLTERKPLTEIISVFAGMMNRSADAQANIKTVVVP